MAESEDRTEAPTGRRLQKAREEGQVALSREMVTLATLAAATALLWSRGGAMVSWLVHDLALVFESLHAHDFREASAHALVSGLWVAGPVAVVVLAGASIATLLQTRLLLTPSALAPKFSRLDPRKRLARIFGFAALLEAGKSLLKLAVVAAAAGFALRSAAPQLNNSLGWTAGMLGQHTADAVMHVLVWVLAAQAGITMMDVTITQIRHWRSLRMSRNEIRDEHKDTEGDPMIKRRVRQIQQQRARRRMMAAVPQATVVLTNPTHYAVALSYDPAKGAAPRVVAKGADEVAARIREVATSNGVPLVANPPLARALFKVELDAEIPAEHFRVVAEIIAYVWRLKGRLRPAAA